MSVFTQVNGISRIVDRFGVATNNPFMKCVPKIIVSCLLAIAFDASLLSEMLLAEGGPPDRSVIRFSHPGGLVFDGQTLDLSLSSAAENVSIHFTLDGTAPTADSERYSEPVRIDKTTIVRAIGVQDEHVVARGACSYLVASPELKEFSSNLPLVIVEAFGRDIDAEAQWDSRAPRRSVYAVMINTGPKNKGRATFDQSPAFQGRCGMRVRGQTSAHFDKKQYSLEVWDELDEDLSVSLLGLPADSDWILHAPWLDKTLMRNVLAYQWSREMGHYATRTKFVELFHNVEGGVIDKSDYRGVYVLMEKIKLGPHRVAIAKLTESIITNPEITGGYIFKNDKGTRNDVHFNGNLHRWGFVEPDQPNRQQFAYLRGEIENLERVLRSKQFADPTSGYAKYLDVASFIDGHIHVELCKNVDGFRYSAYLHKDRNRKIRFGPVWDYNLSLGNSFSHEGDQPDGWYYDTIDADEYLYYEWLFADPNFALRYWDRYFALRESVFDTQKVIRQIDDIAELLEESQARNFERWPIFDARLFRHPEVVMSLKSHQAQVGWLKQFVSERLSWMDKQFPPPPRIRLRAVGDSKFAVAIQTATAGASIVFTTDGTEPRGMDGKPSATSEIWEPNMPLTVSKPVIVKARTFQAGKWGALGTKRP